VHTKTELEDVKGSPGRPKHRRQDNTPVRTNFKHDPIIEDVFHLAQDRGEWRTVVSAVMNIQVA
jgi:hypothetical protein